MATISKFLFPMTLIATLGCGLMGGVFFAFSSFVMKAFVRLPPKEGIAAMQSVNIAVLNPVFLGVFMGTTVLCGLIVLISLFRWGSPGSAYRLAGGMVYVIGNFLVTGVCNVPMNDRLAATNPSSPEAAAIWANYLIYWTLWNHVRTVTGLAAAALLTMALLYRAAES
jgi:uncharacterized membrane protein